MKKPNTLGGLLAVVDQLRAGFKNMVKDYTVFFKKNQGAFLGERSTYVAEPDTIDEPNKKYNRLVQTTVEEKLEWFIDQAKPLVDAVFSQEATNASGTAKAELVVDNVSWGIFSSLELLRLKSVLESAEYGNLGEMYEGIPVFSDSEQWEPTTAEMYEDRKVLETPVQTIINKTSKKDVYIVNDPHASANRPPVTATKDIAIILGTQTLQQFSGQWSHRKRALVLKRKQDLLTAVVIALKEANEVAPVASQLTAEKLFGYLHG